MCIPLLRPPISSGHGASARHGHRCSRRSACIGYKLSYTACPDRREAELEGFKGRLPLTSCILASASGKSCWDLVPIVRPLSGLHPALRSPPSLHTRLLLFYHLYPLHHLFYLFSLFYIILIERSTFYPAVRFVIAAPWPLSTHEHTPVRAMLLLVSRRKYS